MSKRRQNNNVIYDYDSDEYITDKRNKKRHVDRRKKKHMKNALRAGNVNLLEQIEESDEFF